MKMEIFLLAIWRRALSVVSGEEKDNGELDQVSSQDFTQELFSFFFLSIKYAQTPHKQRLGVNKSQSTQTKGRDA